MIAPGKLLLRKLQLESPALDCNANWFPGIGDSCNHIPIFQASAQRVHSL